MGGGRYPRGARSAVAGGQRQQPGIATQVGEAREVRDVLLPGEVVVEVLLAQLEEEPFHEEVDQLLEQAGLEEVVAPYELQGTEDVVLFLPDPAHQSFVRIHDRLIHRSGGDLLPVLLATIGSDPTPGGPMAVSAYILIQTEVGKAAQVAQEVDGIDGVVSAEDVTGPYDVIARAEAATVDELGKMVVSRVQMIDGITRTLTCPVVHL